MLELPQRHRATNALGHGLRLPWCLRQVRTRRSTRAPIRPEVIDCIRFLTRAHRPAASGVQCPNQIGLQTAQNRPRLASAQSGRRQRGPARTVNGGLARKCVIGGVLRCSHGLGCEPARICRHGSKRARQPVSPCKIASDAHAKSIRGELPRIPRQLDRELVTKDARLGAVDERGAGRLLGDAEVFWLRHTPGLVIC